MKIPGREEIQSLWCLWTVQSNISPLHSKSINKNHSHYGLSGWSQIWESFCLYEVETRRQRVCDWSDSRVIRNWRKWGGVLSQSLGGRDFGFYLWSVVWRHKQQWYSTQKCIWSPTHVTWYVYNSDKERLDVLEIAHNCPTFDNVREFYLKPSWSRYIHF